MIKRNGIIFVLIAAMFCSCYTTTQVGSDNAGAIMTGAAIGNQVGGAIGGLIGENSRGGRGAFRGSAIGSILGTIAGAAIGNAVSQPREERYQEAEIIPEQSTAETIRYNSQVKIKQIRFIDDNRNQQINSNEECKIIFEIINDSDRPLRNVIPVVEEISGMKRIYISSSIMIEYIAPHDGIKYTAHISTGKKLKTGSALFHVGVVDEYGTELNWQEFEIPTSR